MYFNSIIYMVIFLPIVVIVYFLLNKKHLVVASKIWLIVASMFFYAWWNVAYLPLLILIVSCNYAFFKLVKKLQNNDNKKAKTMLILGIIFNILVLGYFKYTNFFIETINLLFKQNLLYLNIFLPLAISFHTFQQIAFLVDSYKDKSISYSFIDYCLFVMFFPQLIVGPIVKHSEMIGQFNNLRTKLFNHKNFIIGLSMFLIGFYKKTLIVSPLYSTIDLNLPMIGQFSTLESWIFWLVEAMHNYLDFSSYMDMALGSALIFNIKLPINFNSPFHSANIAEFWKRWHITLARFLKEYIYIPLGGSRKGEARSNLNVFLTFLIGGLWHGAYFGAVIWGIYHGLGIIIYRFWRKLNISIPNFFAMCITITFVGSAGVLLRLNDLNKVWHFFASMFNPSNLILPSFEAKNLIFNTSNGLHSWPIISLGIVSMMLLLTFTKKSVEAYDVVKNIKPCYAHVFILALFIVGIIYIYNPPTGFLYYNF